MKNIEITNNSLDSIKRAVDLLSKRISAPTRLLPTYGIPQEDHPHIEQDSNGFHYVIVERGQETRRDTTRDLEELLYWIFEAITFEMAIEYELQNRIEAQDSRRLTWKHQLDLLGKLDDSWRKRAEREIESILRSYPYDDVASIRARLTKELRDEGYPPERAWEMACEKYPLPKS